MTAQKPTRRRLSKHNSPEPARHRDAAAYRDATHAARRAILERRPFPTDTEIAVLHQRLLAGHPYAADAAIERLLPVLEHLVRRAFPRSDDALIVNAAEDTLLEYSRRPQRFDQSRGVPLLAFLRLAAVRNAANLVRGESRRLTKQRAVHEELQALLATEGPFPDFDESRDADRLATLDSALGEAVRPEEELAAAVWLKGERGSHQIAAALGAHRLPVGEQRRIVKQFKDRIRRRLERLLRPKR